MAIKFSRNIFFSPPPLLFFPLLFEDRLECSGKGQKGVEPPSLFFLSLFSFRFVQRGEMRETV